MLTLIILLIPFIGSLIGLFLKEKKQIRLNAIITSLLCFGLTVFAMANFEKGNLYNYQININWIMSSGISLNLAMDGISLLLVFLTTFLVPLIVLSSFNTEVKNANVFYSLILFMESALIGVFVSFDGLVFYIFWEMALIPIYFISALWGGENRIKVTFKFFIYTILGSLFMLVGLIYLYTLTPDPHTFNYLSLRNLQLTSEQQNLIFWLFFIAFAVKIPIFPFHTWQPDTYTTAPNAGSMLLSGIMLKMGIFGIIRYILPITPLAVQSFGYLVIILSIIGLIYAAIITIKQKELKRFIAYSSMSHVGLIAAACFTLSDNGISGAVFQMLAHGVNVVGMFFIATIFYDRLKNTQISSLGGIAKSAPIFSIFFMIVMLANVALPLTNSFVGEFLMLSALFNYNIFIAIIAGTSIIFGAVYMLWLYQKAIYGETMPATENFTDLTRNELIIAIPIVCMIFLMGLYPSLFTQFANLPVSTLTIK